MTTFTTYIKKQVNRNDPQGDFAKDFKYIIENLPYHPHCRGTETIESETLLGHYNFLPNYAKKNRSILQSLCQLWQEWLEYKHIGLKYEQIQRGYVYFFRLKKKTNIFKIGRTQKELENRLTSVANSEKAELELYDYILINHYNIIEKELHEAFKNNRIMREWFELSPFVLSDAILLYKFTDSSAQIFSEDEESYELIN